MIKFAGRLHNSAPKDDQAGEEIRISWRSVGHSEVFVEVYGDIVRAGNALKSLERCSNSVVIAVSWGSRPESGDPRSANTGLLPGRDLIWTRET